MKRILLTFVIVALFWGCEQEDDSDIIIQSNSIAKDLEQMIINENVESVLPCPLGNTCSGGSSEFSFPNDNFILVSNTRYYNLNHLIRTEIGKDQADKIQMTLYFDPYW